MGAIFNVFSGSLGFLAKTGEQTLGASGNVLEQKWDAKIERRFLEDNLLGIDDISSQTHSYKEYIPIVFGNVQIAGNVIWAGKLQSEIRQTNGNTFAKVYHNIAVENIFNHPLAMSALQGVGAFKNTNTEFETTYHLDFAIGICEGEVDEVISVKADGNELDLSIYKHKIYFGSQTQNVNSTILQTEGENRTPAFRGLCYIVFEEFPLHNFGNKIPKFLFSVRRSISAINPSSANQLVKGITLIPGTGEFVYHPEKVVKHRVKALRNGGQIIVEESRQAMNFHNNTEKSNIVLSLDNLQKQMPNVEWISLVVCWFGNSLDVALCEIYPACEFNDYNMTTFPHIWSVAGKNRWQSMVISTDANGNPRYGGTPSDNSVIALLQELKTRGYKVLLLPMIMMDTHQKPWRGRITGSPSAMQNFFHKETGYNKFIKHYANLCKNHIDALVIGTEMIGITKVMDLNNNFPAVDELCNLVNEVREIVGNSVKLTYAADWSEYHHTEDGFYNMDKLWANSNIDFIGIDAYFPLTQTTVRPTIDEIKSGWESGEGYDFVYNNTRTEKVNISPQWAWKNLKYFLENYHTNANGTITPWQPNMKKVWFVEYGFPSVDFCTNQPNLFYDPTSSESGFPRGSGGNVDFESQNNAIIATEEYWQKNSHIVENKMLWTWDARPYPFFPRLESVWKDAQNWQFGHWVSGKNMNCFIIDIIKHLLRNAGIDNLQEDVITGAVSGMVLKSSASIKNMLETLSILYNFKIFEYNSKIFAKEIKNLPIFEIDSGDILIDEHHNEILDSSSNKNNSVHLLTMYFYDVEKSSIINHVTAVDTTFPNGTHQAISVPIVVSSFQAQEIAKKTLTVINAIKTKTITLPHKPEYANLHAGSIIKFQNQEFTGLIEEMSFKNNMITIEMVEFSKLLFEVLRYPILEGNTVQPAQVILEEQPPQLYIVDTHNIETTKPNDTFCLYFAFSNVPIQGCTLYYSTDTQTFAKLFTILTNSVVGIVDEATTFQTHEYTKDLQNTIRVFVPNGTVIENKPSLCVIGREVIFFEKSTIVDENMYELSHLIRGRYGSTPEENLDGKTFMLLNNFTHKFYFPYNTNKIYFKLVPNGKNIHTVEAMEFTPEKNSAKFWKIQKIHTQTIHGEENSTLIEWIYQDSSRKNLFEVSKPSLHSFVLNINNNTHIVHGKNSFVYNSEIPIENLSVNEI